MKIVLTVISQIVLAYILGFFVPYFGGIGNGLELLAIPIGMTAGTLIGGLISYPLNSKLALTTLVGAFVGVMPLAIPNITLGFTGILLPFLGSMAGFYGYLQFDKKRP